MEAYELITNEEIRTAFGNANFGKKDDRYYLDKAVKQVSEGYSTGHFMFCIMCELGLREKEGNKLTVLGNKYLNLINK